MSDTCPNSKKCLAPLFIIRHSCNQPITDDRTKLATGANSVQDGVKISDSSLGLSALDNTETTPVGFLLRRKAQKTSAMRPDEQGAENDAHVSMRGCRGNEFYDRWRRTAFDREAPLGASFQPSIVAQKDPL